MKGFTLFALGLASIAIKRTNVMNFWRTNSLENEMPRITTLEDNSNVEGMSEPKPPPTTQKQPVVEHMEPMPEVTKMLDMDHGTFLRMWL